MCKTKGVYEWFYNVEKQRVIPIVRQNVISLKKIMLILISKGYFILLKLKPTTPQ